MSSKTIAFQGEHGAYSEETIRKHLGDVKTLPRRNFLGIFQAVQRGEADYGLLPVENSIAGSVAQSYEYLFEFDLRIQAEFILRIRHALLAPKGTQLDQIMRVRSHPQALAQCEDYLRRRQWEAVPAYDTAGSARDLANSPETGTAAIASAFAGELYGLDILERGIEDEPFNSTRFFLIGYDTPTRNAVPQKTSLVFAVRHLPAALYQCLGAFANNNVNLTKLESRPMRSKPWQYWFFVDFEGHAEDPACEKALTELIRNASMVKLLGSYAAAPLDADGMPSN